MNKHLADTCRIYGELAAATDKMKTDSRQAEHLQKMKALKKVIIQNLVENNIRYVHLKSTGEFLLLKQKDQKFKPDRAVYQAVFVKTLRDLQFPQAKLQSALDKYNSYIEKCIQEGSTSSMDLVKRKKLPVEIRLAEMQS